MIVPKDVTTTVVYTFLPKFSSQLVMCCETSCAVTWRKLAAGLITDLNPTRASDQRPIPKLPLLAFSLGRTGSLRHRTTQSTG